MQSLKTRGLLTQVNYSEKCVLGGGLNCRRLWENFSFDTASAHHAVMGTGGMKIVEL